MKATTQQYVTEQLTVSLPDLMKMLCVGRSTAERIAEEAGAGFKIGNRKLYNVKRVQAYIDTLTGTES